MLKSYLIVFQKTHNLFFLVGVFFLFYNKSYSQFEKSESAPASVRWYEKKSKNFKVFFPLGLDSVAEHTITHLENNINKIKINPGDKIRRSHIVLHNQNNIPNAFVASSPRRSEFFINARPESSHFIHNNNWVNLLSDHEYRHLVQREVGYSSFFNRAVHYLFGQGVSSLLTRSSMPNWYWEGDAVDIETRVGDFGRGRIPKFNLTTRTNKLSGIKLKYNRQILGSFKHKTPNEYETGYLMVKYLKDNYGIDAFNKMVKKAHQQSFLPLPFYRAMKKTTGLNYKNLYFESISSLPTKTIKKTISPINNEIKKSYSSFKYPVETEGGEVVFIRQGLGSYQDFRILTPQGKASKLVTPGVLNDFGRIPYSNGLIVWLEFDKDGRWDKRTYSVIKVFNIKQRKIVAKSNKTFYSSADISPNGNEVFTLKNNLDGSQSFVFQNITLNKITETKRLSGGVFSNIKYVSNNKLLGIKTKDGKKTVFIYNKKEGSFNTLLSTYKNIGWPLLTDDYIIFTTDHNGFEEIVFYEKKSKKTYLFDEGETGNYYPSFSRDKKSLLYSSMNSMGFDIFKTNISRENLSLADVKMGKKITANKHTQLDTTTYKSQKTNPLLHFIRPVYWGISEFNFDSKGIEYVTLGVESKNLFGSLLFNGGYQFDIRDKKPIRFLGFSYQGLYPIIDFSISSSNDSFNQNIIINNNSGSYDTLLNADINYKIKEFSIGSRIPLSFSKGKYFSNFLGLIEFSNEKFLDFYTTALSSESGRFPLVSSRDTRSYFSGFVYYSRKHKKPSRNVYFPYEQTFLFETKNTTKKSHYVGDYFRSDIYLAFPGVVFLHSLRGKFRYEKQSTSDYSFRRNINFIHGFKNKYLFDSFFGWGIEYEVPIVYPDFSIGPLLNIKRVRATLFVNGGSVDGKTPTFPHTHYQESPLSYGCELNLDLNFFRQTSLFDFGVRYSYVTNANYINKKSTIEITLGSIAF